MKELLWLTANEELRHMTTEMRRLTVAGIRVQLGSNLYASPNVCGHTIRQFRSEVLQTLRREM